jgi:hypothetical protein
MGLLVLGGTAVAVVGAAMPSQAAPSSAHATSTPGFTAAQTRLLDSRTTGGAFTGFTQAESTAPSGDAVELTITAVSPTGKGDVVVYPDGTSEPTASNLNFVAGTTVSNTVIVTPPASGEVDLVVQGASTNLLVDQVGYFDPSTVTGKTPTRIGDSRVAGDGFSKTGPFTGVVTLPIPAGTDPTTTDVLALNVTAVPSSSGAGDVAVYPGGTVPATSSLNYSTGAATANLVLVTPSDGTISFDVVGVAANLVVDVDGYAPSGSSFAGSSVRLADSRTGSGLAEGPLSGPQTLTIPTADLPAGTTAVALNITGVKATAAGYVEAYEGGTTLPSPASQLQFTTTGALAQTVVVPVSSTGTVTIDVVTGKTQVVVDLEGTIGAANDE